MGLEDNTITAQRVKQYQQEFLVGVFTIDQLLKFTKYTERLIWDYDENNEPIYNDEIQRKLEKSRVEKIADFLIFDPDATFPTNIVLAIPSQVISAIEEEKEITKVELRKEVFYEVEQEKKGNRRGDIFITIIDGQHRIRGIEVAIQRLKDEIDVLSKVLRNRENPELVEKRAYLSDKLKWLLNIELMVSFFIDPTLEFQAMIFSTINRTQKSVPQSLVYSLFGLTTGDSPQKTALEVVLALNSHSKSPFYNRIKLYGGSYGRNQSPPLSQSMMVKSILNLISANSKEAEKDRFKSRRKLLRGGNEKHIFRKLYARNEDDLIGDILFAFFSAVRKIFKNEEGISYWEFQDNNRPTNILQTTVGYQALLLILIDIFNKNFKNELILEGKADQISFYEAYLTKVKEIDFTDQGRYPFTSKSRKLFYLDLSLGIWPPEDIYDDRLKERNAILLNE